MAPNELGVSDAAAAVAAGDISPVELLEACLDRIQSTDAELGALAAIDFEDVRATARGLTDSPAAGPLWGVPIAVKDVIDVAGSATTANCEAQRGFVAKEDATSVARLKTAGAIVLGKTNTHELAHGVSCPASRNPWSTEHMTGGSSGGSAAGVAARQFPGALGTDTGGSVRIPASYCGITGLRPTTGLIPRDGVHMISWTYDTVGPLARSAEDCALLLKIMAGPSAEDPYSTREPLYGARPVDGLSLGVPDPQFFDAIDTEPDILEILQDAVNILDGIVGTIKTVSVPHMSRHADAGRTIVFAESAQLLDSLYRTCPGGIGEGPRSIIEYGRQVTGPQLARAHNERVQFKSDYDAVFRDQHIDMIITPVTPNNVLKHGAENLHGEPLIPATLPFTYPVGGAALPAIALPGGFSRDGMPIGFQLVGSHMSDLTLASVGSEYQRRTDWHRMAPDW